MNQIKLYAASVPGARAIPERERIGAVIRHGLREWMELVGEWEIERSRGASG